MRFKNKIDCHTHIVTEQIKEEYFLKTSGYAIVMEFLSKFIENGFPDDSYNTVKNDSRMFLSPVIDLTDDIPAQLEKIERNISSFRIVGVKIFLTYQSGRADDERLFPVYEFCGRHRLTVTYHNGSCALMLPSDNDIEGSNALYVKNAALKFPGVNFVIAHMDDPRYRECIDIVHSCDNLYTDFSGAYEPGTKEGADMSWAIETFADAINRYPDTYKKILYGTDFCPPIRLSAIEEYEYTIEKIFSPEQHEDIYINNALRAFPRLSDYIKKG